jgi:hypothetical protein
MYEPLESPRQRWQDWENKNWTEEDAHSYQLEYYKKNKDSICRKKKEYRKNNREKWLEFRRKYDAKTKEHRDAYWKEYTVKYRSKRVEKSRELKANILSHYGGQICACCGETGFEFLSIDHINGDGSKHRAQLKKEGISFYRWLEKNNWPVGFRVLCMNCNFSMGHYGYCPHEKKENV